MDTGYARRYRHLYAHHWWWRAREALLLAQLRRLRPRAGWRRILDVGCGDGLFFPRLRELGHVVEGVEPDPAMLEGAAARAPGVHVQRFETFRPPQRYALILMLDVLEHVSQPEGFLRHALELLEPGGTLVLTVPAFRLLWTNHDVVNHHVTRYTKVSFNAVAAAAGLRIERAQYFFHWLFAAKLLARGLERLTHRAPRPAVVPWAPINRAAYVVSRWEHILLGGLRLPLGSSLLVVGGAADSDDPRPHTGRPR